MKTYGWGGAGAWRVPNGKGVCGMPQVHLNPTAITNALSEEEIYHEVGNEILWFNSSYL